MAYLGNTPTTQAFTPAVDYFSGNGSTTAFTLSRPVASVAQVEAVIDNVVQNPSSAYTVSSNTITFTSAPLSGTNNIYVRYTSPITQVIAPGQGTVNTTALGNITNIASGNSSLTLQTGSGNTTAVTIDTSQNVGIGTSSPTQKLQVAGNAFISAGQYFMWDNAGAWSLQSDASTYVRTFINGNEKLRVNAYGIGIGGAIPSSGTGITFPATINASSNANTLDDYEEGTWSPSVTSQSGSITSYTVTDATYTKIGRMVTLYCNIQITNIGTASGQMFIAGMPFNTLSSGQYLGVTRETTATGYIYFPMAAGSQINVQNSTNGGITWATNYRYQSTNVYETT